MADSILLNEIHSQPQTLSRLLTEGHEEVEPSPPIFGRAASATSSSQPADRPTTQRVHAVRAGRVQRHHRHARNAVALHPLQRASTDGRRPRRGESRNPASRPTSSRWSKRPPAGLPDARGDQRRRVAAVGGRRPHAAAPGRRGTQHRGDQDLHRAAPHAGDAVRRARRRRSAACRTARVPAEVERRSRSRPEPSMRPRRCSRMPGTAS